MRTRAEIDLLREGFIRAFRFDSRGFAHGDIVDEAARVFPYEKITRPRERAHCGTRYRVVNGRVQFRGGAMKEWHEHDATTQQYLATLADLFTNPTETVDA